MVRIIASEVAMLDQASTGVSAMKVDDFELHVCKLRSLDMVELSSTWHIFWISCKINSRFKEVVESAFADQSRRMNGPQIFLQPPFGSKVWSFKQNDSNEPLNIKHNLQTNSTTQVPQVSR